MRPVSHRDKGPTRALRGPVGASGSSPGHTRWCRAAAPRVGSLGGPAAGVALVRCLGRQVLSIEDGGGLCVVDDDHNGAANTLASLACQDVSLTPRYNRFAASTTIVASTQVGPATPRFTLAREAAQSGRQLAAPA